MNFLALVLLFLVAPSLVEGGTISRPTKTFGGSSFVNGVTPQASDFNGDLDTIYTEFNGNIDNNNIKASAQIDGSKINPTFNVMVQANTVGDPCYNYINTNLAVNARRWVTCFENGVGSWVLSTINDDSTNEIRRITVNRATGNITLGDSSATGAAHQIYGSTTFNQPVTFNANTSLLPTGTVQMYLGTTAPAGWLLTDGTSYACNTYSSLCGQLVSLYLSVNYKGTANATVTADSVGNQINHTAHGFSTGQRIHFSTTGTMPTGIDQVTLYCVTSVTANTYQIGLACGGAAITITSNGTGTLSEYINFVTPDMRSRAPLAAGQGAGLTNRVIGSTGGEESHTLSNAETPLRAHTHDLGLYANGAGGNVGIGTGSFQTNTTTSGITGGALSGTAHNVMDPYYVLTFMIKT